MFVGVEIMFIIFYLQHLETLPFCAIKAEQLAQSSGGRCGCSFYL